MSNYTVQQQLTGTVDEPRITLGTVTTTPAVIVGPVETKLARKMAVEVVNSGANQINGTIEASASSAGPWFDTQSSLLDAIAAGASRLNPFDITGYQWIRVRAATAAATSTGTVAAWLVDQP